MTTLFYSILFKNDFVHNLDFTFAFDYISSNNT